MLKLKATVSVLLLFFGLLSSAFAFAVDPALVQAAFQKNFPHIKIINVKAAPFQGVFQLELDNGEIVYTNESADHMLVGARLIQIKGPGNLVDLTDQRERQQRLSLLKNIPETEMVVFEGEGQNITPVYVFTDVDCGYCRKLHQEIPALNKAGVEVRYLAWPRAGVDSDAGRKMHNIWCAKNQQSAMTIAKSGGAPSDVDKDCLSPLAQQFKLGMQMGVQGTPAVFTESGKQIGGYLSAKDLVKQLEAHKNPQK